MVLVMKLTSFAWSVYDGQRNPTELDPTQELSKITELPSLSSFLGYCFFFPSILAGPSYTYASYISFTSHELFKQESNQMKLPAGRRRKALRRLATGLFFLGKHLKDYHPKLKTNRINFIGIYSVYGAQISYFQMLSPEFATRPYVIR